MKRLIFILFILFGLMLLPVTAHAWLNQAIVGSSISSAGCTTTIQSETVASAGSHILGNDAASRQWNATKFVATETTTVCKVNLYLEKFGSPTFNIKVHIYSHDAGNDEPDTLIGTSSDVINAATLTTSEAIYSFVNISASITNTTTYWVVVECVTVGDADNYGRWHHNETGTTERVVRDADGLGTWTLTSTTRTGKYVLFKN